MSKLAFSNVPEGVLMLYVDLNISAHEMAAWPTRAIGAFFEGISQAVSAAHYARRQIAAAEATRKRSASADAPLCPTSDNAGPSNPTGRFPETDAPGRMSDAGVRDSKRPDDPATPLKGPDEPVCTDSAASEADLAGCDMTPPEPTRELPEER